MQIDNILISVIVPVYNVEQYLSRCIDSLINQSFVNYNYEVILVDDGSTDNSSELCDEIEKKSTLFHTIHKHNGGLGSARNCGIKNARGKYLCFVDSDDLIHNDYLKKLYEGITQNDADICICGYNYSSGNYVSVIAPQKEIIDRKTMLERFACGDSIFNFAWNKLYKSSVIKQMYMLYSDRHCAEDMYFNCYYYSLVNRVSIISDPLYTYFINLNSLSNGRRANFWNDMLLINDVFRRLCKSSDISQSYCDTLDIVLLRNSISNYFNSKSTKFGEFKKFLKECLKGIDAKCLFPVYDKMNWTDKIIFYFIKNKLFFFLYLSILVIKLIKKNFFIFFCRIRENNKRR